MNEKLYKNAVLYFIKYCNNQYLHKTKLNKLLYYLDFISVRDHKKSVTGDIYTHQEYGPVPAHADEILTQLKIDGAIDTEVASFKDGELINFTLKDETQFNESVFSVDQKNFLKISAMSLAVGRQKRLLLKLILRPPGFIPNPMKLSITATCKILISSRNNCRYGLGLC